MDARRPGYFQLRSGGRWLRFKLVAGRLTLFAMVLNESHTTLVFDNFHGRRIRQSVHKAMVARKHQVLQHRIVFKLLYFQSDLDAVVHVQVVGVALLIIR